MSPNKKKIQIKYLNFGAKDIYWHEKKEVNWDPDPVSS